jgi:hypothetical protein
LTGGGLAFPASWQASPPHQQNRMPPGKPGKTLQNTKKRPQSLTNA